MFGIFARWGYGKSTVLNYLKHELTTNHSDEVVVFEFNPWFFTGQEDLLAAFFSGLAARLEQALAGRTKDAGQILKKYSGIFGLIPIVGTGASKLAEQIGTEMSENSLANQRRRAFEIMSGAERTVVVLIDDLDRLDRDEILIMLKLIRLNANVPRVVYVLAFDDQMVAAAVGAKYNAGPELGRQFLEKIVQYPFTLPAVGRERLASFAMSQARSACASAGVALSDQGWSAMADIVDKCFLRRLTTPRQAIRYVNALEFALPMLAGKVNPFEQILVEGLRVLFPELYGLLRDDVQLISKVDASGSIIHLNEEKLNTYCSKAIGGGHSDDVAAGKRILLELFAEPRRANSIARRGNFNRYFMYAMSADDASETEILSALEECADDESLSLRLRSRFQDRPDALMQSIYLAPIVLDSQGDISRVELPLDQMARLATALARCGDILHPDPEDWLNTLSPFAHPRSPEGQQRMERLWEILIRSVRTGDEREVELFTNIIRVATPPHMAVRLFSKLRYEVVEERISNSMRAAAASRMLELAQILPSRFFAADSFGVLELLSLWNACDPDGQRAWLESHLRKSPRDAIPTAAFVQHLKERPQKSSQEAIESIASPALLKRTLEALDPEAVRKNHIALRYMERL